MAASSPHEADSLPGAGADERLGEAVGLRPGERIVPLPATFDAGVYFIGRIRTPWHERSACPRRGDTEAGPECQIEIDPRWREALSGLEAGSYLQVLYWMHLARRDAVVQNPSSHGRLAGTFSLRSPLRPNPIASSIVRLVAVEGATLVVRGLDCIDGTPLVDLKPDRCPVTR